MSQDFVPSRRGVLAAGAGLFSLALVRPARATPESMAEAVRAFTGGAAVNKGRVALTVPPLVENGNAVPLTVKVESAMTAAEHVRRIGVFNERNPQPHIAVFHLGPRSGRAQVGTRVRLGDSQMVMAVAELSDGTFWSGSADVIVTLPACIES